jgi:hypothetical protein
VALKWLPFPIRFRLESGAVFPMGPAGGSATAFAGDVELVFPAGALSGDVGITVARATNLPADAAAPIAGTAFDFGPDGSQFAQPVRLTIRYDAAAAPSGVDQATLKLHKLVGSDWVLVAGSSADVAAMKVSGDITSFSEYAVLPVRTDLGLVGDIAFQTGGPIVLIKEDGTDPITLTGAVSQGHLAWSIDGSKLAFSGTGGIHILGATPADSRVLPYSIAWNGSLTWARPGPLGDLFWSGALDDGSTGDGFAANSATGAVQTVTFSRPPHSWVQRDIPHPDDDGFRWGQIACDGGSGGQDPVPSPDGTRIAFRYTESCVYTDHPELGRFTHRSVGFANAATGEVIGDFIEFNPYHQLFADGGPGAGAILSYAWSRDGSKLVVVVDAGETAHDALFLVDIATRSAVPLLTRAMFGLPCEYPSDDGYLCDRSLHLVGFDGLAWSPVEDKIALALWHAADNDSDGFADGLSDIFVLDLSVTPHTIRNLTRGWEEPDTDPTWSPDGTKIAFVRERFDAPTNQAVTNIYVVGASVPLAATPLTTGVNFNHTPRWRPRP